MVVCSLGMLGRQLGVIPKDPRFHQRAEGSRVGRNCGWSARDPSLRLKYGYAQDDALEASA